MTAKLILHDLKYDLKNTVFTLLCTALSSVLTSFIFVSAVRAARAEIAFSHGGAESSGAILMFVIIAAAVIAAGCFMIRSAVDLSFSRKLKTLAVLSSLGAGDAEKTAFLLFQACIYAVFGAFAGALFGGYLSGVFLSSLKSSLFEFAGYDFSGAWYEPAFAFAVCFAAVLLPSLKPAARLRKINIIDAQRNNEKINISLKDNVFTVWAEKLFGYTGRLAGQFFDNDRRKYRAVTAALSFGEGFLFFFRAFPEYSKQNGGTPSPDGLTVIYMLTLPVLFFAVAAALPSAISALGMKKRQFALLRSVGASDGMIYKISIIESAYFALSTAFFTLISAVAGSYAMLMCVRISDPGELYVFAFPFAACIPCALVNAAVVILFLICEAANIKKNDTAKMLAAGE